MAAEEVREEGQATGRPQGQSIRLTLDDRGVMTRHCNYWLVTSTPEEVVLGFGGGTRGGNGPAKIDTKVVLNYYNAKRLLGALEQTLGNYERALGATSVEAKTP